MYIYIYILSGGGRKVFLNFCGKRASTNNLSHVTTPAWDPHHSVKEALRSSMKGMEEGRGTCPGVVVSLWSLKFGCRGGGGGGIVAALAGMVK